MLGTEGDHTCGGGLWHRVEAGTPGGDSWEGEGTEKPKDLRHDKCDLVMCDNWRMGEKKDPGQLDMSCHLLTGRSQLGERSLVWVMI